MDWGRKRLRNFIFGKIELVSFDCLNNVDAIHVKIDGSVLYEK